MYAACGLALDGAVYCFSAPRTAQPEGPVPDKPVRMPLKPSVQVEVGNYTACSLSVDRDVDCFDIMFGASGEFGEPQPLGARGAQHIALGGESGLVCVSGKARTTCAYLRMPAEPLDLPGAGLLSVSLGDRHGCFLAAGTVGCFDESRIRRGKPQVVADAGPPEPIPPVPGIEPVRSLAVGGMHNCAQKQDGKILCWGDNDVGQVNPRSREVQIPAPVEVGSYPPDWTLDAHFRLSCVNSPDARYHCWGNCGELPTLPKLECTGFGPKLVGRDEL